MIIKTIAKYKLMAMRGSPIVTGLLVAYLTSFKIQAQLYNLIGVWVYVPIILAFLIFCVFCVGWVDWRIGLLGEELTFMHENNKGLKKHLDKIKDK